MFNSMRTAVRRLMRITIRPGNIPLAIAAVVMVATAVFAEQQNRAVYEQSQRAFVLDRVALIRAQLEGKVTANIQLVHGLVSTIATEPDLGEERFARLAQHLFMQDHQLRNIAAAPDLIVRYVHPLGGNELALGLNYTTNADQRDATLRARDTRQIVLAGPVHLVQGGRGFIGRFPVFYTNAEGADTFWGVISAVIDADRLYDESGLTASASDIAIAISGKDGLGMRGPVFYGDAEVLGRDPVSAEVVLPAGRWVISAVPQGGWNQTPPNTLQLRLIMALAAGLVLVPILLMGRLNNERRNRLVDQRRREDELARLSRRLELALSTSQVGVWEMNIVTGHLSWDSRMNEIYGLPTDDGKRDYTHWRNALHPDDLERAEREFNEAVRSGGRYSSNFRVLTPGGQVRYIRALGAVYQDTGSSPRILGVNWDTTADAKLSEALLRAKSQAEAKNFELETAKARIEHNALHDPLTGLPNRRYLDDILEMHAQRSARVGGAASILHIDLDRFKQINDTLGHAAGDAMLIHASEILKNAVRQSDFVARIGGDEFVIFCVGEKTNGDLKILAERIIVAMRQPVPYKGHECRFGVSIGIASGSGDQISPKQLLVNADIALYRAKRHGRNRCEFFSQELQMEIVTTKRVADDILSGLENDEFLAYYQPQFCAKTLDIIGVEALARWQHPQRGMLTPDSFMQIADDLNVIATLDRMILEKALAQHKAWRAQGIDIPRISVNVSARRLHDETLLDTLRELDIEPGTLSFELVESIYLDDSDAIAGWKLDQIKDLGIDIEIDDFGTGYASIVSLLQLQPKRLKIDRQLVMPITASQEQRRLLASIIEIGASLGIEALAEGVETHEHARILEELGCTALQGYAFARPMSAEDIVGFVRSQRWRKAG